MKPTIAIGGDHAGFSLKKEIKDWLAAEKYGIMDFGPFSENSVDYPDFVHPLSTAIQERHFSKGILICGSGNGVCMTANKYPDVRAALVWNEELAKLAREHNDANVLCLPARFISTESGLACVKIFLETAFEGGRHLRRVNKIVPPALKHNDEPQN
jgi:ribose 5-phosphate isomerase B